MADDIKHLIQTYLIHQLFCILIEQVSCGNGYRAPSCSHCPFSENWCDGECEFDWDENKCKEKGKSIFLNSEMESKWINGWF